LLLTNIFPVEIQYHYKTTFIFYYWDTYTKQQQANTNYIYINDFTAKFVANWYPSSANFFIPIS